MFIENRITKIARPAAISLAVLYVVMMALGLALETAAGSYFAGTEPLAVIVEVSVMTIWIVVGFLIVSRSPGHPVGWVWLLIPVIVAVDHLTWGLAYYGLNTNPGSLPGVSAAIVWNYWNGRTIGILPLTLLFLLFPTGKPLSRHWGWLAWISVGALAIHLPVAAIAPVPIGELPFPLDLLGAGKSLKSFLTPLFWISGVLLVGGAILATISLGIRLRQSVGVERQQIKWFVYAAAFFIPGVFLIIVSRIQRVMSEDVVFTIGVGLTLIAITGMAVASAVAILRYRLWDIDIIIRRTLIYGSLTVVLALLYFGVVTLLQGLVTVISGQSSPVVTVVSTLVIAALFTPLRRRIQDLIDRRFYRQKYDAEKIILSFLVQSRDEVDIDELAIRLLAVVDDTLKPESVSLWLRSRKDRSAKDYHLRRESVNSLYP
jgi:hypothetical protein